MPEEKQERVVKTEAAGYDVSFTCNVPYATLYVDDMANGTASGTRFLKTGNHSIKVIADGYESLLQTIVVNSSSTSFSLYLKKMPAPPTDNKQKDDKPSISCPNTNHPHVIDLDLPSGTKWACCNVGATSPEKIGNDYAWGVTIIENDNSWKTYKWGRSKTKLTKYNTKKKNGIVDNKMTLDALDDAATVNWGAQWCMPTNAQLLELFINTSSEWTTLKGVYGRKFTSKKNGRSIFLPAGDVRYGGTYWSKTLYESDPSCAWALKFDRGSIRNSEYIRNSCFFVRPILKK